MGLRIVTVKVLNSYLLLYKGKTLSMGLDSMLERIVLRCGFKVDKFLEGTDLSCEKTECEVFWDLFNRWKDETDITEEDCVEWIKMLERHISVRTTGIMEGNHRNYYEECAAFIAAYGEVCESRGVNGTKSDIMEAYKMKYSRRRAFHQELRNYGMVK